MFNYHWKREEQQKYAEHRLFKFIRDYVFEYHPYYRRSMLEASIEPKQLNTYEDFQHIPLTTFDDLAAEPEAFRLGAIAGDEPVDMGRATWHSKLHYGRRALAAGFHSDSLGERRSLKLRLQEQSNADWSPIHYHLVTREGSDPLPLIYTLKDLRGPVSSVAAMLYMSGYRPGMRVMNLFPCTSEGFVQSLAAGWLVKPPVSVLHTWGEQSIVEKQVELAASEGCEILMGYADDLRSWLETAAGMKARGEIAGLPRLEKIYIASDAQDGTVFLEMKKALAQAGAGQAQVLRGYGRPEMRALFFECTEKKGIHLNPEFFFWEVLDPVTREPVRWGEPGVLTFSHFDWCGTVLLRYWTGDLVEGGLFWERCSECGMVTPSIHPPITHLAQGEG